MQMTVFIASLAGMAVIAFIFFLAVRYSTLAGLERSPTGGSGRSRSRLVWALVLLGVVLTVGTLRPWPHDLVASADRLSVNVTGGQWYWEIDRDKIPVGKTVVFNVHTKDVNHGMGVYDDRGRLLFQIQAMPGYVNKVKYTFAKAGTYRILCLEFCGLAHHEMISSFEVVAGS